MFQKIKEFLLHLTVEENIKVAMRKETDESNRKIRVRT